MTIAKVSSLQFLGSVPNVCVDNVISETRSRDVNFIRKYTILRVRKAEYYPCTKIGKLFKIDGSCAICRVNKAGKSVRENAKGV